MANVAGLILRYTSGIFLVDGGCRLKKSYLYSRIYPIKCIKYDFFHG